MGRGIAMSTPIPEPRRKNTSRNHSRGVAIIDLKTPDQGLNRLLDKELLSVILRLMKRSAQKAATSIASTNERRKLVCATLVGSALISPKGGAKAMTGGLDNVNKVGAVLHT